MIPNKAAESQSMAFCAELEAEGVDPLSYDGERLIRNWLGMLTPERRKCGAQLRRFERFNRMRCWPCSQRILGGHS